MQAPAPRLASGQGLTLWSASVAGSNRRGHGVPEAHLTPLGAPRIAGSPFRGVYPPQNAFQGSWASVGSKKQSARPGVVAPAAGPNHEQQESAVMANNKNTLYVSPLSPCTTCAGAIIQAGISQVVAKCGHIANPSQWSELFKLAIISLDEAGVSVTIIED